MARYKRFAAGKIFAQAEFTSAEHVQSPWGGAASRRGTQKQKTAVGGLLFLVRAMGLEPTRPYGHKHLKLACLPIPARSRTKPTLL